MLIQEEGCGGNANIPHFHTNPSGRIEVESTSAVLQVCASTNSCNYLWVVHTNAISQLQI